MAKKKVIALCPQDFPIDPNTSESITGVKAMFFLDVNYELSDYLEQSIEQGILDLKDVLNEICNRDAWDDFCKEYKDPYVNTDGVVGFIERYTPYRTVLILENDDTAMMCLICGVDDFETIGDLRYTILNMEKLITKNSTPTSHHNKTTTTEAISMPMFVDI